jgi:hypothetical protein
MTRVITGLGDRMLGALLRTTEAGACIPEHGQSCGTVPCSGGYCGSDGRWFQKYCTAKFNCYGNCLSTGTFARYQKTGALC